MKSNHNDRYNRSSRPENDRPERPSEAPDNPAMNKPYEEMTPEERAQYHARAAWNLSRGINEREDAAADRPQRVANAPRRVAAPAYANGYRGEHNRYDNEPEEPENNGPKTGLKIFGMVIMFVLLGLSIAIGYVFQRYNVLPVKYRYPLMAIMLILNIIVIFLVLRGRKSKALLTTGISFGVIFTILFTAVSYYLFGGIDALNDLNILKKERIVPMQILVLNDSEITTLDQLPGARVEGPVSSDSENINRLIEDIADENGITITPTDVSGYMEGVDRLYAGENDAILFSKAYLDSVKEHYPDFETETREVFAKDITVKTEDVVKRVDTESESFTMFISGIDTYGPISTVARSDVNILMTVNPKTKKILLTSIARDTYLPIAGGGQNQGDKLTHAGIYGISSSIQTIENFLDIEINYYSRVNFTSLIELVDILGGITVDNPVAFKSVAGYYFEEGNIYLDGEAALAYSRERYNLPAGDLDRGMNQQRVIIGILNKAMSSDILSNYQTLLSKFREVAETNMPTEDIMGLVNVQLKGGADWDIEMNSIKGTGTMDMQSWAMPGYKLWMYLPDQQSVQETHDKIISVLSGQQ